MWRTSGRRRWLARSGLSVALVGVLLASSGQLPPTPAFADVAQPGARPGEARGLAAQQVGELAPEFTVVTPDGQPVTSADLLAQEKPFILYFFATW
jgi:cytochrome oxidase Cu insertion factor (SCO1/SenC/PrrC family)